MKKYLIQITTTGTERNPNFSGVVSTSVCGKGSFSNIDREVCYEDHRIIKPVVRRLALEFGYDTEGSAKVGLAALKKHHDEEAARYGFHTFKHEIVCVEF